MVFYYSNRKKVYQYREIIIGHITHKLGMMLIGLYNWSHKLEEDHTSNVKIYE